MRYKILGYVVWHASARSVRVLWTWGRLYVRYRYGNKPRNAAAALLAVGALGGAAAPVAQRRREPA
jgi:hypothetical protein